jgi:hypothetical protein
MNAAYQQYPPRVERPRAHADPDGAAPMTAEQPTYPYGMHRRLDSGENVAVEDAGGGYASVRYSDLSGCPIWTGICLWRDVPIVLLDADHRAVAYAKAVAADTNVIADNNKLQQILDILQGR